MNLKVGSVIKVVTLYNKENNRVSVVDIPKYSKGELKEVYIKGLYIPKGYIKDSSNINEKLDYILGYSDIYEGNIGLFPIMTKKEFNSISGTRLRKEVRSKLDDLFKRYEKPKVSYVTSSQLIKFLKKIDTNSKYKVYCFDEMEDYTKGESSTYFTIAKKSSDNYIIDGVNIFTEYKGNTLSFKYITNLISKIDLEYVMKIIKIKGK